MPRLIDDLRATGKVAMPYYVLPRRGRLGSTTPSAFWKQRAIRTCRCC